MALVHLIVNMGGESTLTKNNCACYELEVAAFL